MSENVGLDRVTGERVIEGPTSNLILPRQFIQKLKAGLATPSVANIEKVRCSGVTTTITDFLQGQEGQSIDIVGDGFTTITHGTNIKTNTAASKLLAADKVYRFTLILGVWIEQEGGTTASGGGTANLIFPFVPPVSPNAMDDEFGGSSLNVKWSWVNQGTATATVGEGVLKFVAPVTTSNSVKMLVQTSPAAPYTIQAAFHPGTNKGGAPTFLGLVLYNSGTGKFEEIAYVTGNLVRVDRWTSVTSYSGTVGTTINLPVAIAMMHVRVVVSSTLVSYQFSINGLSWWEIYSSTISAHLVAITRVGFFIDNATTGNPEVSMLGRFFRRTA